MQLEDYFDFIAPDAIRIRGTRIGIEVVLEEYYEGRTAEDIAQDYPPLTCEKVHAVLTYYLHNKSEMDAYLQRWRDMGAENLRQQALSNNPLIERLRQLRKSMASS